MPDAHQITAVDRSSGRQVARLGLGRCAGEFPDGARRDQRAAPSRLPQARAPCRVRHDSGAPVARLPVCDDTDDVFLDAKLQRIYLRRGAGFIDVIQRHGDRYEESARIPTIRARTALFVPSVIASILRSAPAAARGAAVHGSSGPPHRREAAQGRSFRGNMSPSCGTHFRLLATKGMTANPLERSAFLRSETGRLNRGAHDRWGATSAQLRVAGWPSVVDPLSQSRGMAGLQILQADTLGTARSA